MVVTVPLVTLGNLFGENVYQILFHTDKSFSYYNQIEPSLRGDPSLAVGYYCFILWNRGKRADVSSDGQRLPPAMDTRRRRHKCVVFRVFRLR